MSYTNTFITVSEDCPVNNSEIPQKRNGKTPIHLKQLELLSETPYNYDHYELIFKLHLWKNDLESLSNDEKQHVWDELFSKGHPCMRASALVKRYGYGAHYDDEGKIAIYPIESEEYKKFLEDDAVTKIKGMRSKR